MSQETDEIKSKIDLVDLISGYIKLIPAGANSRALCPFHNEKTPSFMVSAEKQIWKCFGCGKGGDIFTFLMEIEGLEFYEALKLLAERAGVKLKTSAPEIGNQKNRLIDLCQLAARYWHKILIDSPRAEVETAREYLKNRGLAIETIEDFQLGYAIDSWDDLINFLIKRGFSETEVFQAGLAVKKDRGSGCYDRFRGRLMFPIVDLAGRVAGFGGRTLKSEDSAKYINTPQTILYNKSLVLYGLVYAKEAIKKEDVCILVEGYMDVIPSHQAGIKNVAAISGTALTLEQVKILKRYSNNLILALDMDLAGRQAAVRSIDVALQEEMNVKVVNLPQGKDPGECIKNNLGDWLKAIKNAQSIMDYFFQEVFSQYDPVKPENKKVIVKLLLPKILKLGSQVEQDYWLKKLAQDLSVSENILREIINRLASGRKPAVSSDPTKQAGKGGEISRETILLEKILTLIFIYPQYLSEVVNNLPLEFWTEEKVAALYKNLVLFYTKNTSLFADIAVDKLVKPEKGESFDLFNSFKNWLKINNQEENLGILDDSFLLGQKDFFGLTAQEAKAEINNLLKILKTNFLNRRISGLKREMEEAEKADNQAKIEQIYLELNDLIRQKSSD